MTFINSRGQCIGAYWILALFCLLATMRPIPLKAEETNNSPEKPNQTIEDYAQKAFVGKINKLCKKAAEVKSKGERREIILEIMKLGSKTAPHLTGICRNKRGTMQLVAAQALVKMKVDGVADLLLGIVSKKDNAPSPEILKLLASLKDMRALPVFLKMQAEADRETRRAIFYCLTFYNDNIAFDCLFKGLKDDDRVIHSYSRICLKRLLIANNRPEATSDKSWNKKLLQCSLELMNDIRKAHKAGKISDAIKYMEILGLTNQEKAAAFLAKMLNDKSAPVRAGAVTALGNLGSNSIEYIDGLIDALDDPKINVRLRAMKALASLKAVEAVPIIAEQLSSGNKRIQRIATKALQDITGQKHGPYQEAWMQWWETRNE